MSRTGFEPVTRCLKGSLDPHPTPTDPASVQPFAHPGAGRCGARMAARGDRVVTAAGEVAAMGDRAARWILEALEAYVLGDDAADELRAAFRAGVRAGRELSTLSTPLRRAVGFRVSPLQPPSTTSSMGLDLLQDPLVDPKSTARANVEGGTLELFPRTVPLERR